MLIKALSILRLSSMALKKIPISIPGITSGISVSISATALPRKVMRPKAYAVGSDSRRLATATVGAMV